MPIECSECKEECLDPDDVPDHIRRREHSIDTNIFKLPDTMIISVSCFKSDSTKIMFKVQPEDSLDFSKKSITNTDESVIYKLSSVIYHVGNTLSSGHYITCVNKDDTQVIFDDDTFTNDTSILQHKNCTPYVFFYDKMTSK